MLMSDTVLFDLESTCSNRWQGHKNGRSKFAPGLHVFLIRSCVCLQTAQFFFKDKEP